SDDSPRTRGRLGNDARAGATRGVTYSLEIAFGRRRGDIDYLHTGISEEINMPNKKNRMSSQANALQILRGGKAVPKELVKRCVADLQQRRNKELDKRNSTERQMAKFLGQSQGQSKPDAKASDGLLGIHRKLAKQKLVPPRVRGGLGGVLPGRITATIVPPFDYNIVIPTRLAGNDATIEASSNRLTGQMNASAITNTKKGFNGGSMYTSVGVYFHPLGPGTLTLHATPTFSFQWWTNSVGPNSLVQSFGSGGLTIYGVAVATTPAGG